MCLQRRTLFTREIEKDYCSATIPIEFLHRASDFQFSAFENGGLSADFEPHSVLIGISLLVNLVDIGFD